MFYSPLSRRWGASGRKGGPQNGVLRESIQSTTSCAAPLVASIEEALFILVKRCLTT